jgi:hypothetical protein
MANVINAKRIDRLMKDLAQDPKSGKYLAEQIRKTMLTKKGSE